LDKPKIDGISPLFIVKDVAAAFGFYCDKLGFDVTFQAEPDNLFFGIVKRDGAMIFEGRRRQAAAEPCARRG
jgi:catechol 2,3-dioxygenase-like lactoylglutathione lyase family enzyme